MTSLATALKLGDIILSADPFVHLLNHGARGMYCDNCYEKRSYLKPCSGCGILRYCNLSCRVNDWKAHHSHGECIVYQQAGRNRETRSLFTNDAALFLLRLYLSLQSQPDRGTLPFRVPDGSLKSFDGLESKTESMGQAKWSVSVLATVMRQLKPLIKDLDADLVRRLHSKYFYYRLAILSDNMQSVGYGIYIETSAFSHSCVPNAAAIWFGNSIEVRAVKPLPAGQKITISWVDLYQSTDERRKFLSDRYFMFCKCDRCAQRSDLTFKEKISLDWLKSERTAITAMKDYLQLFACIKKDVPILKKVYGDFHPVLTHHMVRWGRMMQSKWCREVCDKHRQKIFFQVLKTCLLVTHGPDHPLYIEFKDVFTGNQ